MKASSESGLWAMRTVVRAPAGGAAVVAAELIGHTVSECRRSPGPAPAADAFHGRLTRPRTAAAAAGSRQPATRVEIKRAGRTRRTGERERTPMTLLLFGKACGVPHVSL